MPTALNALGQVALYVDDVDAADAFYTDVLGLRRLYRYGDLAFFDCAGVRLLLSSPEPGRFVAGGPTLYFRVADLALAVADLKTRGVRFVQESGRVAEMDDHDLWMAFFEDPAGNTLGLMQEAPKGYAPGA